MTALRFILPAILLTATVAAQQPTQPCAGLPPGKHAVLERMTADFGLTCEQELKIEPLLHDEESVTRPLLRFTSFSADQQQAVMLKIKLAARRQIRLLLTPDQQKLIDVDMQNVARSSGKGGKSAVQNASGPARSDALENEEALSKAVMSYVAMRPEEKKTIVLEIKRAFRADGRQQLTPEQQKALDSEIADFSKSALRN